MAPTISDYDPSDYSDYGDYGAPPVVLGPAPRLPLPGFGIPSPGGPAAGEPVAPAAYSENKPVQAPYGLFTVL